MNARSSRNAAAGRAGVLVRGARGRATALVAVLMLSAGGCQLGGYPVTMPQPRPSGSGPSAGEVEASILDLINAFRADADVPALTDEPASGRAARLYATELAERGELSHDSPTPGLETFAKRLAAAGAPAWSLAGENLAEVDWLSRNVAGDALRLWNGSSGHREQMLNAEYTDTGVGVARDEAGTWYIVQLFLRRR